MNSNERNQGETVIRFSMEQGALYITTTDEDIKNRLDDLCENVRGFYPGEVYKVEQSAIYAAWLVLGKMLDKKARYNYQRHNKTK